MTKALGKTLSVAVLLLSLALVTWGQTTLTTTTLSAAVNSTQTTLTVASATGISARGLAQAKGGVGGSTTPANLTLLVVDREAMEVEGVSSTTITVRRHAQGTGQAAHASGAKVYVGPAGAFPAYDPSGTCTRTQLQYVPWVNLRTGIAWDCAGGKWGNFVDTPAVGTAIASQGGEMTGAYAIIGKVTHITGTAAITGWAIPAGLRDGDYFVTIPDGAFTWTAAGNIVSTGTAVVGRAITWTYDATAAKLYPNQ